MEYIKGNLIELFKANRFDGIAHGCNCFHTMAAGIAGQLAREFEEVLVADKLQTKYGDIKKLGTYSTAHTVYGMVFNMYTQFKPGRESAVRLYRSVKDAFYQLNREYGGYGEFVLGIPKIGSGIAGGSWPTIERAINDTCTNIRVVVIDYEP